MQALRRYGLLFIKVVALIFGFAMFVRLVSHADYSKVIALLQQAGALLLLVPIPYIIASFFDTLGWRQTFPLIGRSVFFSKLFSVKLMSEAMLMSLPGGTALAESLKPLLLNRICAISVSEAIATGMMRNCFLSIGHSMYVLVSVIVGYEFLARSSEQIIGFDGLPVVTLGASLTVLLLFGTVAAIFLYGSVAEKLHRALLQIPFSPLRTWLLQQEEKILDIDHQFSKFRRLSLKEASVAILFFVIAWFFETVETFLIMKLLGIHLSFAEVLALESALSLVRSMIVFLPAGIGIQDYGYVRFLDGFGIADSADSGAAFVLVKRTKEVFWIIFGYILLAFADLKPKEVVAQSLKP
ncbi:MAG: UPF0104 family protein [Candidatus Thermochlorobacter aerophilum]|jgi:hypothetical protein|uniref:UPF0104 family protein n=1 Tax=Candidatus Thermochlorobacter aerophilus TaxID=1868324 RepID=A0A395M2W7_9BACT|nr:MAG: UPF0104 family protein [Candidatus Thermochlorobacter aerophilum]